MGNTYSPTWFELFLQPLPPEQTEREVAFVERWMPRPQFTWLLDVCCGEGRHARALAERGYRVIGIDRNKDALEHASRQSDGSTLYLQRDMRKLDGLALTADGVVVLWQSFGQFDAATNGSILRQIRNKLEPGGRAILDIYHREFFERNCGVRTFERGGRGITETKRMDGDRLTVNLAYGSSGDSESFEWQLYTPAEIQELGASFGFDTLAMCSGFDEAIPASADVPRMQIVFEAKTPERSIGRA